MDRQIYVDAVIERKDEVAACQQILEAAQGVERAGADFIVICCNDVHRFVPEIAPKIGIPFLHIATATADAIKAAKLKSIGLLGVRKTMEGAFYPDILIEQRIHAVIPSEDEKAYIHDTIYNELVHDIFTDETRQGYLDVINSLAARGAEGVALACTEIPLLLKPEDIPIPSFSTTELHCKAAIEKVLAES